MTLDVLILSLLKSHPSLLNSSSLGIFALSAIIVDKAEPSEALKANIVWSAGLEKPIFLLSTAQVESFRVGKTILQEDLDFFHEQLLING
jgi:hypothetical protein